MRGWVGLDYHFIYILNRLNRSGQVGLGYIMQLFIKQVKRVGSGQVNRLSI